MLVTPPPSAAPRLGVLADDLTGGMISASLLERDGVRCPLVLDADELGALPGGAGAVVLARKIRLIEPDAARAEARAAASAFARCGVPRVYSKYSGLFDSTRRGNIGPIAEELLDALGAPYTIFCPAYIERRLTVYQGHLFVRSVPLDRSFKRHDPASPAWTSDLVESLRAQSRAEVGLLPHEVVAQGPAAIHAAIAAAVARRPGIRFFVADAVDDADVDNLAAAVADWPVVTGADSLVPALARAVFADAGADGGSASAGPGAAGPASAAGSPRAGSLPVVAGPAAVLAGSCAEPTRRQLDAFERRRPVRRVRLADEGDRAGLADEIAAWAAPHLASGPVAVATSADPEQVAAAHQRFGREGASALADRVLGDVARRLHARGVRNLVVAGGETSGEVLAALGVRQLDVAPFDDMYGGHGHRRGPDPLAVVLKPGSFGEDDFWFRALDRLAGVAAEPTA